MTSRLSQEQLTNRVIEVFNVNEPVYKVIGLFEEEPKIVVDFGTHQDTFNMGERPEAMHYLLGLREDFGD